MPTYVYYDLEEKQEVELFLSISEKEKREFNIDGKRYIKENGKKLKRIFVSNLDCAGTWPCVSAMGGCHPAQIGEFMKFDKDNGVDGVTYNNDGDVIWPDRKSKRDWCKAHGLYDKNAGYSDAKPVNI